MNEKEKSFTFADIGDWVDVWAGIACLGWEEASKRGLRDVDCAADGEEVGGVNGTARGFKGCWVCC